ncbi:hypothetical protein GCM10010980_17490 [Corynebacterium marinum]|nr:hypothetical protein GCM10010980_17490 [Corynebacterium marinum]
MHGGSDQGYEAKTGRTDFGTAPSTNAASQFHGSGEARVVSVGLAKSATLAIRERRRDHAVLQNIGEDTAGRSSAPVPSGFPRPRYPGEDWPNGPGPAAGKHTRTQCIRGILVREELLGDNFIRTGVNITSPIALIIEPLGVQ